MEIWSFVYFLGLVQCQRGCRIRAHDFFRGIEYADKGHRFIVYQDPILYEPYTKHLFLQYFAQSKYRSVTLAKNLLSSRISSEPCKTCIFIKTQFFGI